MKHRFLVSLFIAAFLFCNPAAFAQIVGSDAFLQGAWLEIGMQQSGALGATTSPAGYHPHPPSALGHVYDYGFDGWTVGTPEYMGDYTYPGCPFEGWTIQMNGARGQQNNTGCGTGVTTFGAGATMAITGFTSYSNVGGIIKANWEGNFSYSGSSLVIKQETRVDTFASWVVFTARIYNTSGTTAPAVYYMRSCDPDNDESWVGPTGFTTDNMVNHENDVAHRAEATGTATTAPHSKLSICTKDCRATSLIYNAWPLTESQDLATLWDKTYGPPGTGAFYDTTHTIHTGDIAIGVVFKIGDIAPGDSAVVSCAWVYNGENGIDSAFPEPTLVVNGTPIAPSGPAPAPTFDTILPCVVATPIVTVNVLNATDKCWTWSKWTWSPSAGLSSTTGVSNTINSGALAGPTTFTITGTDSAAGNYSCNQRVLYLTVIPCFSATSSSPGPYGTPSTPSGPKGYYTGTICLYDSLLLFAHGDSTDATYFWYGPGGYTSTGQYTYRLGMTMADTGWYSVVKTVGGSSDTTETYVVLSPKPIMTASSNSPVCSQDTLNLFITPDSATQTYSWTGPNGFTSTLQNPSITSTPVMDSGYYRVIVDLHSCLDTAYAFVHVDSTPEVPVVSSNSPGPPGATLCPTDTLKLFATDGTLGVTWLWAGPLSFASSLQNPVIPNVSSSATGIYTVTASTGSMCTATASTVVTVTPTPPLVATNNGPVCTGVKDTLLLRALSIPGATFTWTGPYTFYSLNQNPFRSPVLMEYAGVYQVQAMFRGCPSAVVNDTVYIRQTPKPPVVPWLTFCQYFDAPPMQAMGDSVLWYPTVSPPSVGSLIAPIPSTDNIGVTWFYVSQTLASCTSAIDSARVNIIPKPTVSIAPGFTVCPHDSVILTATDTDPIAFFHWSPPIFLSDTSGPSVICRPEKNVHYTVVASNQFGCTDTALVAVAVQSGAVLYLGDSVTLFPGESYQITPQTNCVNFAWYPPAGLDNPHVSNPVATPQISTKYIVHASTASGCEIVDSINIFLDPESSLALPNAFTPGGTVNKEFKVIIRGIAELKYFRIWDRWGVKVFETTDINKGWDGTYSGKPQPFGVFVYEIGAVTSTGKDFIKHGNVTLIR